LDFRERPRDDAGGIGIKTFSDGETS